MPRSPTVASVSRHLSHSSTWGICLASQHRDTEGEVQSANLATHLRGEKRLTNKMRINLYSSMCFSVYRSQSQWTHQDRCIRWQGWIESTQISALVTSDSENVLLTNGMPSSLLTTFRTGTNFCKIGCCLTFSLRGVTPMINDMALRRFPVGQNIC